MKKQGDIKVVTLPVINYDVTKLRIKGTTSLISNKMGESAFKELDDKITNQDNTLKKRKVVNHEKEFLESIHFIDQEKFICGFPSQGIKKGMLSVAYRLYGESQTALAGMFSISDVLVEIRGPKPKMRLDFMPIQKKIKACAEFLEWEMEISFEYLSDSISLNIIIQLLNLAGRLVGLGRSRVEKKGTNGKYEVISKI